MGSEGERERGEEIDEGDDDGCQSRQGLSAKQGAVLVRICYQICQDSLSLSLCTCLPQTQAAMACGSLPLWPEPSPGQQHNHSTHQFLERFPFLYVFLILYGSHVSCAVGTHLTWLGMSDGEGRYQIRRETLERGFDIWNVNPPLFCLLPVPLAHMGDYFPFK